MAAACGQLAGAYYGAAAIPAAWSDCLLQRDLVESYADRLLEHYLLQVA
jgi:ADP-ribosyl-[dinitrogen reductase] hydrolase